VNKLQSEERINILMVDDSPTNLLALESILRAPDRNLIHASSGEEALRYLLDSEAAVVLLDVYMPGIDGLETAELIRSREKLRDIPIIFLTANTTGVRHLTRGYSLGAVDYIVKPVEPEILRSKVAVFVELFKKTREIRRQAQLLHEKNLELENTNLARLNMLIDLGHELAAEHDPAQVLAKFCRAGRKIVEADEAAAGMFDHDGKTLRYFFSCNSQKETVSEAGIPFVVKRALDLLVAEKRPLRLSESDDLLLDADLESDSVESFLGAPILSAAGVAGWVYLLNKIDAADFSEADGRLAATLATQVAVAFENARLYTKAQIHADELRSEIAERKQAEEERAQLLVREQAARAEAEQANRTKDEFLATLSHELRTPLSAILGWSHLVRSNKLDEAQLSRGLETIERNARSQSQLIDDLLDVSRIITGKLQIEYRPVDLPTVIEAAIDSVRPAVEAKEIKFETAVESASPVLGDANRLQQIFWNLFSNAVKFTRAGGQVNVAVKRRDSQVQISVTDTGIGISAEFLPYIFDRFRQADGSTTRAHGGLGLGLAIVRHLVELHQGTIEVESRGKDQGSTFTVRFPIAPAARLHHSGDVEALQPQVADLFLNSSKILDGLRILVVDDEEDSRDLVTTILTRCGSEVRCSESADEAILAFEEWNPDLLVTDIGMPIEDGYSLIKRLRNLRSTRAKQIPAVALTAYATDEDRSLALSAGFQMHLTKPIEPQSLVTSIAAALGREPLSE
jgi:signal transduction histidine kinase/DNA-binding response OmpR family regulator